MSFLKLLPVVDCSADGFFQAISTYFEENDIDMTRCMMFTSDGASVMLGKTNGLQAKIKVKNIVIYNDYIVIRYW